MLSSWSRAAQYTINYETLGISRTIYLRAEPQNALCNDIIMAHISFAFSSTQSLGPSLNPQPPPLVKKTEQTGDQGLFCPLCFLGWRREGGVFILPKWVKHQRPWPQESPSLPQDRSH